MIPITPAVILIVHVFRTGRERFWVSIMVFIPLAGSIGYLIVEILPGLLRERETLQERCSIPSSNSTAESRMTASLSATP